MFSYSSSDQASCHALLQRLHLLAAVIRSFSGRGGEVYLECCRFCPPVQAERSVEQEAGASYCCDKRKQGERTGFEEEKNLLSNITVTLLRMLSEPGSHPGGDVWQPPKLSKVFDLTHFNSSVCRI